MVDPKIAGKKFREHLKEVSPRDFERNLARYSPDFFSESRDVAESEVGMTQIVLFQPEPAPLKLTAYLASALTGLNADQRQLVSQLSDTVAQVCKEHNIDLYEPRKATDPVHHPDVSDTEVFRTDRKQVLSSDLVIHLTHYPSTGAGEELDFALSALLPIILISHAETRVSRMVTGIPGFQLHLKYNDPEELRIELDERLAEVRPILEERKLAFTKYDVNLVGDRIRALREGLGITREELAASAPLLTARFIQQLEDSPDRIANPSLLQLRQIATVLKTTVADLVEPDVSERMIALLEEWISGRTDAARFGIDVKDRNRLLRRMLLRVIDSLEE